MKHKLIAIAAIAATAAALPAATPAQKPPKGDLKLSIAASDGVVKFGHDLVLTGKLTGGTPQEVSGQSITLQRDAHPYEGKFERAGVVDTNDAGEYGFTLKPGSNAKYRAVEKGKVQSPEVTVDVRVAVTLAVSDTSPPRGERVDFTGTVAPAHDGKKAKVQRRKRGGGWKTLKRTVLADAGDAFSSYSTKVRIRRAGRYRVRFSPRDGDHRAGNSNVVRIALD